MKHIPASLFRFALRWVQPRQAPYSIPQALQLDSGQGKNHTAASGVEIPKVLWTYWNQEVPDAFVSQCIDSWRLQCSDHRVIVVHPGNLHDYVAAGDLPEQFAELAPPKQADWLRLYLVSHHGGYWLDATILLTQSLEWMQQHSRADRDFVGFYLDGFTRDPQFPVIESWAFGAPAGTPFVTAWFEEFHQALITEGTDAYLQRLQAAPNWQALSQGIADAHYLLIHVTAQQVLRRDVPARMALYKAEDTAYYYHLALRWKWYLLYPQLCLAAAPAAVAPLVKLRGGERRHFAQMLQQHGGAAPASLWHRALHPGHKAG